jgi:hypothetical protein
VYAHGRFSSKKFSICSSPLGVSLDNLIKRAPDYADLRRVDGGLGAEDERDRIGDLLLRAGLVVNIEKRRIDRYYPG